jgi:hypothetical protein
MWKCSPPTRSRICVLFSLRAALVIACASLYCIIGFNWPSSGVQLVLQSDLLRQLLLPRVLP